jgi:phenylalanyl-tRNA synthetase alpha chain
LAELRENDVRMLNALERMQGRGTIEQVSRESGLQLSAAMRAALSLQDHKLLTIMERKRAFIRLTEEGMCYAELKVPERRLVEAALGAGGESDVEELGKKTHVPKDMLTIAIGWIRRKEWGGIVKRDGRLALSVVKEPDKTADELLLNMIFEKKLLEIEDVPTELKEALALLKGRNLIELDEKTERSIELTSAGLQAVEKGIKTTEETTALTSDLIVSGKWKSIKLREYDVSASPPELYPGKKNIFFEFIEEAKRVLTAMGFEEYEGPYVETEFWNFDVLFQAQDHPAREIHDSYRVKHPKQGRIDLSELADRVKSTHENGWITKSTGWGYKWNYDLARRLVLRTQTTAVSVRYLSTHQKPPIKMYCLSKVFRPDVLDAQHGMEFYQLDGIVGDEGITLRHLLGFLREFAAVLGLGEVKFRPHYFPFTEPSVESYVRHPNLGWVEFVGSGIFRPEVLKPLGIDFPVIAWGIGFDRLAMIALGIDDIRELYSRRLDWLRTKPVR